MIRISKVFPISTRVASALTVALLLPRGTVCAQTTAQPSVQTAPASLAFDVATIRPSPPFDAAKMQAMIQAGRMPKFGAQVDASHAEYTYMSLKDLVATAYNVKTYQVTGPDWLSQQRFDIAAKLPEGAKPADAPAMLKALLADRFKLTAHMESQEHPVMALAVAKGGPKMKESPAPEPIDENTPLKEREMKIETPEGPIRVAMAPGGASMNMGAKGRLTQTFNGANQSMHMEAVGVTMEAFAAMLSNGLVPGSGGPRQVVDATGLPGHYDFALEIPLAGMVRLNGQTPGGGGPAGPDSGVLSDSDPGGGPAGVLASVQALGLKLEPRKATVQQVVIDHVEKAPTEN